MKWLVILKKNNGVNNPASNRNLLAGVITTGTINDANETARIYRAKGFNAGVVPRTSRNIAQYEIPCQMINE